MFFLYDFVAWQHYESRLWQESIKSLDQGSNIVEVCCIELETVFFLNSEQLELSIIYKVTEIL